MNYLLVYLFFIIGGVLVGIGIVIVILLLLIIVVEEVKGG